MCAHKLSPCSATDLSSVLLCDGLIGVICQTDGTLTCHSRCYLGLDWLFSLGQPGVPAVLHPSRNASDTASHPYELVSATGLV